MNTTIKIFLGNVLTNIKSNEENITQDAMRRMAIELKLKNKEYDRTKNKNNIEYELIFDNIKFNIVFYFINENCDKYIDEVSNQNIDKDKILFSYYHFGYVSFDNEQFDDTFQRYKNSLIKKDVFKYKKLKISDVNNKIIENNTITGDYENARTLYLDKDKLVDINNKPEYIENNISKYIAYFIYTFAQEKAYKSIYKEKDLNKLSRIKEIHELYRFSSFEMTTFNKEVFSEMQKRFNMDILHSEMVDYSRICFEDTNSEELRKLNSKAVILNKKMVTITVIMVIIAILTFCITCLPLMFEYINEMVL